MSATKAPHRPAPVGPDAERHAQDAEDEARGRDRELLVDLHQVRVRIALEVRPPSAVACRSSARLISRSPFGVPPCLSERVLQHERDVVEPEAHLAVLLERVGAGLVDRAVEEPQRDPPVHLVRQQPALPRRDEPLLLGLPLVRHEDVPEPHLVRRDLVDVDDEVPEGVVEHALLQPDAGLRPDDVEHERLEGVVALRARHRSSDTRSPPSRRARTPRRARGGGGGSPRTPSGRRSPCRRTDGRTRPGWRAGHPMGMVRTRMAREQIAERAS